MPGAMIFIPATVSFHPRRSAISRMCCRLRARENIETAFLHADTKTLAYFAGLFGKTDDQETFLAYADTVKAQYNENAMT